MNINILTVTDSTTGDSNVIGAYAELGVAEAALWSCIANERSAAKDDGVEIVVDVAKDSRTANVRTAEPGWFKGYAIHIVALDQSRAI